MAPMTLTRDDRLDSWKEIASFLNRGVRTVQRWEATEGLPVRRHQHRKLGSVYALKSEVSAWWKSRSADLAPAQSCSLFDGAGHGSQASSARSSF